MLSAKQQSNVKHIFIENKRLIEVCNMPWSIEEVLTEVAAFGVHLMSGGVHLTTLTGGEGPKSRILHAEEQDGQSHDEMRDRVMVHVDLRSRVSLEFV